LHGYGDVLPDQVRENDLKREGHGISQELAFHVTHMGVVQTIPHVWDLSWLLPWASLRADRCVEDVLALAPHSKIMLGSGQHGIPKFVWLAKIAKRALSTVLTSAASSGLVAEQQATETAQLICHQNAQRLYRFY
jgi:hypothetical protein